MFLLLIKLNALLCVNDVIYSRVEQIIAPLIRLTRCPYAVYFVLPF